MNVAIAAAVDVAVILALSAAALPILRRRSAALRHAWLASAIVAALLMPALELGVPTLPILRPSEHAAPLQPQHVPTSSEAWAAAPVAPMATAPAPGDGLLTLLLILWALGSAVMLSLLILGLVRVARLAVRATPVRSGRWRTVADGLCHGRLWPPIDILQSDDASVLMTFGTLRPRIMLPAGSGDWPDERVRSVLAHEIAHIVRRDTALQLAGELLRVLHWFNPLVWLVCRRLRQESEYACDDQVLRTGVDASNYASHLLAIARHAVTRQRPWPSAVYVAHPSSLERRVEAMLNAQRDRSPVTSRVCLAAVIAVAAIAVPLAAVGVAPEDDASSATVVAPADVVLPPATPIADTGVALIGALPARRPQPRERPAASVVTDAVLEAPPLRSGSAAGAVESAIAGEPPAPTPAVAAAQESSGTVSGVVSDPSGAVLPGASITLTDIDGVRPQRSTVTDGNGRFALRTVPPGRYAMAVSLAGFQTITVALPEAPSAWADTSVRLPLGTLMETIEIACDGSTVALGRVLGRLRQTFAPTVSAQSVPVRVGGNIRAPKRLSYVKPVCPASGVAGDALVLLAGRIGLDGSIVELRPLQTDRPAELIQSAMDAVSQWTFTPTLLNGQPVEIAFSVQARFRK